MSVIVQQYNPAWPEQFQKIQHELQAYLADVSLVSIEHVGSTSVPGLAAKPIIDVDIIVTRENVQSAIDALVNKGNFTYMGECGIKDRHALRDPNQSPSRNIYVCVEGAFQARNHLAVRDTLRSNPALRDEYGKVKLNLAAQGINIIDYVEAKSAILQKILQASGVITAEELTAISAANLKGERFGTTTTARLALREFVVDDVDAFFKLESNPDVVRYQTWPPRTKQQACEEVYKIIRNNNITPRSHVELAVTYNHEFIGRVGANIERGGDRDRAEIPHANLWFSFMPEWQGKGFATEAVEKFIELLGSPMRWEIECDPRNLGSMNMAKRLGFRLVSLEEGVFECKGEMVGSAVFQKIV